MIEDPSIGEASNRAQGEVFNGSLITNDHNHLLYLSSLDVSGAFDWNSTQDWRIIHSGVEPWRLYYLDGTN